MWSFVVLWLFLILWNCEYEKEERLVPFSKENALVLKGICAIEIMLGHIGLATKSIWLYPNRKAGVLFVGIFLALSGYGLMYSVSNKPDYLKGFLKKRLPKILIPAYIVYCLSLIVKCGIQKDFSYIYKMIVPQDIFLGINWYIWELAGLYLLFYIIIRFKGKEKVHWYILVLCVVFSIISYFCGVDNPWYGSIVCFCLGMLFFLNENEFQNRFVNKNYVLHLIGSGAITIGSIGMFFLLGDKSFIGNVIGRNMASFFFVICIILLLYKFKVGNALSEWLGKYSFEIYLIHFSVISICRPYIENTLFFSICVIVITLVAAVLYKNVQEKFFDINETKGKEK